MGINFNLVGQGLTLINFIIGLIWGQEEKGGKSGDDKHDFVQEMVQPWLNEHGVSVKDVSGLIKDIVALLKKHDIFYKNNDQSTAASDEDATD